MAKKPLEGKVALITGAGSPIGLGHSMASGLVRAGANVALADINRDWLEQTVDEVREIGGDNCVIGVIADVTDPQACQDAVETAVEKLGGLHILVNNAGINTRGDGQGATRGANLTNFWENSPETWSRVVAVNLSGNFYMARAAVGHMLDQGWGRIIGVTTSMDSMWREGMAPYGPSKAGHEALVAIMGQESGRHRSYCQCSRSGRRYLYEHDQQRQSRLERRANPGRSDAKSGGLARLG